MNKVPNQHADNNARDAKQNTGTNTREKVHPAITVHDYLIDIST